MDFIGVLLLLALLYGLPELFRKKRKKNYEYPSVPKSQPVPDTSVNLGGNSQKQVSPVLEKKPETFAAKEPDISPQVTVTAISAAIPSSEGLSPIASEQLRTAILWTEILKKPKQIRPYGGKKNQ